MRGTEISALVTQHSSTQSLVLPLYLQFSLYYSHICSFPCIWSCWTTQSTTWPAVLSDDASASHVYKHLFKKTKAHLDCSHELACFHMSKDESRRDDRDFCSICQRLPMFWWCRLWFLQLPDTVSDPATRAVGIWREEGLWIEWIK